jgi:hypothetical protein
MSDAMSDYLEEKLINHVLRNTAFTTPGTTIYVGLIQFYESHILEAGTLTQEVSGGDYARQQHSAWDDPSGSGATENTGVITFPTATADWGWISGVIVSDAATAGNVLLHGALTTPRDVVSGDVFKFNDGDLDISFT